ncbi:MAG TPA: class II glutamine amidotransferase [Solirubrobacteraceae bacterium]|nr:class II glutamine amidotransferase [Solirubrobacteraceae bacterium]
MAWLGQPLRMEELLFKTEHSLVDQSLHARMGAETTNGDGFGVGWFGVGEGAGVYRSVSPAWSDPNLRHLAAHIDTPLFLAHVRASSGSAVQQSNCHPFAHGDWLFVHNGLINEFHRVRRDLLLALDERAVAAIEGSADSEVLFHLALGFGLEAEPIAALEAAIGLVERTLREHYVKPEVQASIGVSNGRGLWAVRYSSVGSSRTLFRSEDVDAVRRLHPQVASLPEYREGDHVVVSEPLTDLPGAWHEIPEATALTIMPGGRWQTRPFAPASA